LLLYIATKIKPITFAVMVAKEYLQGSLTNIRNNIQSQLQILDISNTLNDAILKSCSHQLDKTE
jgi:hypothetical protein